MKRIWSLVISAHHCVSGCGKSCLVEGIYFALGIGSKLLRSQHLQGLVHNGVQTGSAEVTLCFRSRDLDNFALTLQRRIINGKRNEFRLQECRCKAQRSNQLWPCARCRISNNVLRTELRATLMRNLHMDIEAPDRFIVQQAKVLTIAQRSPCDLLRFLEELVGTDHLRLKVEEKLAVAHALKTQIDDEEANLDGLHLKMHQYERCFTVFRDLESSRCHLEQMKSNILLRELPLHLATLDQLQKHELRLAACFQAITIEHQSACNYSTTSSSRYQRTVSQLKTTKRRQSATTSQLDDAKDAAHRALLQQKRHNAAAKRAAKALETLQENRLLIDAQGHSSQIELSKLDQELQQTKVRLLEEQVKLQARERVMEIFVSEGQGKMSTDEQHQESQSRKRSRKSLGKSEGFDEHKRYPQPDKMTEGSRAIEIEIELRTLDACQIASEFELEQKRASSQELSELEASCAESRTALTRLQERARASAASLIESEKVVSEASASLQSAREIRKVILQECTLLRERQACLETRISASGTVEKASIRSRAVFDFRRSDERYASAIHGFLCECFSVKEEYASAVNAALGGMLQSTIVVKDKASALDLVDHMRRERAGIINCLILAELQGSEQMASYGEDNTHQAKINRLLTGPLPLTNFIECEDPAFWPVIPKILSRWQLVRDSHEALALDEHARTKGNVVTLQGECFLYTGEMRTHESHFRNEFALRQTKRAPALSSATLNPKLQQETRAELEELHAKLQKHTVSLRELAATERAQEVTLKEARVHADAAMLQIKALDNQIQIAGADLNCLEKKLDAMRDQENNRVHQELEALTKFSHLGTKDARRQSLLDEAALLFPNSEMWHIIHHNIEALRKKMVSIAEQRSIAEQTLRSTLHRQKALEARQGKLTAQENDAVCRSQQSSSTFMVLNQKVEDATQQLQDHNKEIDRLNAIICEIQQEAEDNQKEVAKLDKCVSSIQDEVFFYQQNISQAKAAVASIQEQLETSRDQIHRNHDLRNKSNTEMSTCDTTDINETVQHNGMSTLMQTNDDLMQAHVELKAAERLFEEKQQRLDTRGLAIFLEASAQAQDASKKLEQLKMNAQVISREIDAIGSERARIFIPALNEIDKDLRDCFRSLVQNGSCCFDFSPQAQILFTEGVQISARPAGSEWMRFNQLSGGQQAIISVALSLSFQVRQTASLCIFDEVDAALDTQRAQALARYVASREGSQAVFVSHRPPMIEVANRLVGVYSSGNGSHSVCISL